MVSIDIFCKTFIRILDFNICLYSFLYKVYIFVSMDVWAQRGHFTHVWVSCYETQVFRRLTVVNGTPGIWVVTL